MQNGKDDMKNELTILILCGGEGERLRPLTADTPKPLINIKGRPILTYLLEHLQKFKLQNIVIAAGFKHEKIYQFFEENHKDLNVQIIESGDVDIIERIKLCAQSIKGDFILLYGDTLADVNFDNLMNFHFSHDSQASITVYPLKSQFGLAEIDSDNNVIEFREKPTLNQWINIGNFYFEKGIIPFLSSFTSFADFLEEAGRQKMLKAFKHDGVHITVNTLRELEEAELNVHEFLKG